MERGGFRTRISIYFLLFILIANFCKAQNDSRSLFMIQQYEKFGFINSNGKIIIQPKFLSAENFSEGLAAVRINGTYGYVDAAGRFIIPAIYDYAQPFSEGLALVHKNQQSLFINVKGDKLFEVNYPIVHSFEHGLAYVQTNSGKVGFINKNGKLTIDTTYVFVRSFHEGLAIARKKVNSGDVFELDNYGVIDSTGKVIIPFGKYSYINDYKNGSFYVKIISKGPTTYGSSKVGFIDKYDHLSFSIENNGEQIIEGDMHNGLAMVAFRSSPYRGFINLNGEIILKDKQYQHVENFNDNRAFVEENDHSYSIINTKGDIVAKNICIQLLKNKVIGEIVSFKNGKAFIENQEGWGLIDTNGHFIIQPQFYKIHGLGIADGVFFYQKISDDENDFVNDEDMYGIAKEDGSIITKPFLQDIDQSGFHSGLLKCVVNGKLTYINKKGNIIWQEKITNEIALRKLNIDFMNRAYFYAYTTNTQKGGSGIAKSGTNSQLISKNDPFPSQKFSLIVFPEKPATVFERHTGIRVVVANASNQNIEFDAQDNRLNMVVQAMNASGEWKDIEYLPVSHGNNYHVLTLKQNEYWSFATPKYEGATKTKLRVKLTYFDPFEDSLKNRWDRKQLVIFSNEYDGTINPGQFWRKGDYSSADIMNPYYD